jgi:phage terminase large subunit-like protein
MTRAKWVRAARPNQLAPERTEDWDVWMLMAGRGFGKTRVGAEDTWWWAYENPGIPIAVVAPTAADIRDTCFEGISGLMNVIPSSLIESYHASLSQITLKNGTMLKGYSAEQPDRVRGSNNGRAWCDELAAWDKSTAMATWDNLMLSMRIGTHPQAVVTSTPKPVELVRQLAHSKRTKLTRGTTFENREHLSPVFFEQIRVYEGTVIGRQELYGELIDLEESGLYKRSWFRLWPARKPLPPFDFVVASYDTAFTDKTSNDPTGCLVLGLFRDPDKSIPSVFLLDAWKDHLRYPDLKEKIMAEHEFAYGENDMKTSLILIENKGSGMDIINDLRPSTRLPLFPWNPGRADKTSRFASVSYVPANGMMWIPESEVRRGQPRDWVEPAMHEWCAFPNVKHDEYVDCLSQGLGFLRDQGHFLPKYVNDDDNYADGRGYDGGNRNPYML